MFLNVTKNMSLTKIITRTFRTTATRYRIIKIQDQEDFNKQVLNSKEPVVIDFFATWCGPCKMLLPRVEKIIEEYKDTIHLAKVDIDDNAEIAMEYGVSVVPELVLMKDGKVQGKMIGLQDEDKLKDFISKLTEPTIENK
ncbi:thioredoxin C-1-like [Metopolophium dirhodum]|uniref:thioredoxin C-1-like n=1 Tax=Metopolophium dirhodum TaxID=44670 RepID=UPI00298FB8D4|nr:thioredoxin C-1-like [Metopolophium dirhodum]